MDTRIMRCAIPVVALALLMGAGCASAQEDPGEVLHRNDCRLAHQILSRGQPDVKRGWALEVIGTCPGQAQQALVATWASPPLDEAELQRLYQASARILDGEVFAAAVRAAEDPTLPALVRLAGLGAGRHPGPSGAEAGPGESPSRRGTRAAHVGRSVGDHR